MADISKITMPSGNTYDLKDAWARTEIGKLASSTKWLGVTTTVLTDGSTTNPITIGGESVTASSGDIVAYTSGSGASAKTTEFIFDGTKWQEFGNVDFSSLGSLAYQNSASGSYTKPSGSGTISNTSTELASTGTYTPAGSVSLTNENQTATVSAAGSGEATYTPAGSVGAPTISVATAGSTATVKNPTKVTVAKTVAAAAPGATAPDNSVTYTSYDSATETLSLYQLGYTTGDSITTENVTVKTGDATYSASAPTFTGTGARLVTGNISVPSSASFSGTEATLSVSGNYDKATGVTVGTTTDTVTVS